MHAIRLSGHHSGDRSVAGRVTTALLAKRRRYNRLYMRLWRANPGHRAAELANRARWHYARKLRQALQGVGADLAQDTTLVCGFCRKAPPVTKVWRLEIRDSAPGGYAEVRVPYCGEC